MKHVKSQNFFKNYKSLTPGMQLSCKALPLLNGTLLNFPNQLSVCVCSRELRHMSALDDDQTRLWYSKNTTTIAKIQQKTYIVKTVIRLSTVLTWHLVLNEKETESNWGNICSSYGSATAACKQSRPKQGEGKDQASDTYTWLPCTWK